MSLMTGGVGHEAKAATYKIGTEKAYHHLTRSIDLFSQALHFRPNYPKAMLSKSKVLIQVAATYQTPRTALTSLREAMQIMRLLVKIAPRSVSARETLAQAAALLSETNMENEDWADDEFRVWNGDTGDLAREALAAMEEVAADRMDRMRALKAAEAAEEAPSMAEMFLALSASAITVSTLAIDLSTVDAHIELAEQALDQASNMATVAAAAKIRSSTSSANLITRIQLASGRSSLERLRHSFQLGMDLDEDDFRSLMSDISMLATECRERAAKLKGSKQAASSTLAWEAIKQLGDAKMLYASMLRQVWRRRKPLNQRGSSAGDIASRKASRNASMEAFTIAEEEEDEKPRLLSVSSMDSRKSSRPSIIAGRKQSSLSNIPDEEEVSTFTPPTPARLGSSFSGCPPSRRGSWLPSANDSGAIFGRSRRLSSMNAPLVGPDGISAWNRKASIISLDKDDKAAGLVPSAELAKSAWQLLESSVKQYKLALTLLQTSDLPAAKLAQAKAETLSAIAYVAMFQASLAPRLAVAMEKRTSLLVSAEVYATWAAREVGWSFLIEGTREAELADRRTNSWRADEVGKRSVMILVRIWWYRAVTAEGIDVETKMAAKDAVEVVVRRMKDREGVKDGDVGRWRLWLSKYEGEMDAAEALFWRSVSRILRGGSGFVMS